MPERAWDEATRPSARAGESWVRMSEGVARDVMGMLKLMEDAWCVLKVTRRTLPRMSAAAAVLNVAKPSMGMYLGST